MARPPQSRNDSRFQLHQRQPRADKLDARQRIICRADPAYAEALSKRVSDPVRFSAFLAGATYYINLDKPCARCGGFKRRTRDRSCYHCHLRRGGENFERMKAGIAPNVKRSLDGHLDVLERRKAERDGEHMHREFDGLIAKRWPTGRLEITLPNGEHEHDINKRTPQEVANATRIYPQLRDALIWAGWF